MIGFTSKALKVLLWIYGIYAVIGLLLVMPALNIAAPWAVEQYLGRELRHDIIVFNPFTMTVEIRGASLHEADGHVPLAVAKAGGSASVASLWRAGVVLDSVRIEELELHVLRYADGSFHFAGLLTTDESASDGGELPGITIDEFFFSANTLRFTDRTKEDIYSAAYSDFSVQTRNISTLPEHSGDGELTLRGADGGVVSWKGEFAIAEGYSVGRLSIDDLDLTHIWRYESERLAFVTDSANLDIDINYDVNWNDELRYAISDGNVRVRKLVLVPKDPVDLPHTSATVADLSIGGINVDSIDASVSVDDVNIRGVLMTGFATEERSSLVDMFTIEGLDNNEEVADGTVAAEDGNTAKAWQLSLARLSLDDSAAEWRSDNLAPEAMRMSPLRFNATDVSWPATGDSNFELALSVNDQTHIETGATLNIGSGTGDVHYQLTTWPLAWLNPVLSRFVRADILDGLLSVSGAVSLDEFMPEDVGADVNLNNFAMQIHGAEDSALKFEELTVTGASADIAASRLSIDDIGLQGLRGALHILEDGSFNISTAMVEQAAGEEAADDNGANGDSPDDVVPQDDSAATTPWGIRVAHVGVRDGQLDFSDASLPLPFQTLIGDIEADINDLDSTAEQPMVATLNGSVDGYAPVVIEASGRPLADPRDAKLELRFRGMDIATMSPYSGTYAGYTIDSGTLSVDLVYGFQGSQLDGDNRIVISQMELGEPIESERAMQIPLQLGLALLTDAAGVIDLAVPISGDVNDPQFSFSGVIFGAIANVIIKAATAPFRLLAGLVDSEQDLENVQFAPGSDELGADGQSALTALAAALEQRPKLLLRIIGSTDPTADRHALQTRALNTELIASGLAEASISAQDGAFVSAVDARYGALQLPAPEDGSAVSLEQKLDALRSRIELPPGTLQDLGTSRATAAKRELVTAGGVDAARIAVAYDKSLLVSGAKMSLDG